MPTPETGEQIKKCFNQFMPSQNGQPPSSDELLLDITGPAGCTSVQDCTKYCSEPEHYEECSKFSEGIEKK